MTWIFGAAVVVVVAATQRAEACSCSGPSLSPTGSIPLNARIPVLGPFVSTPPTFTLMAGEQEVPAVAEAVPGGFIVVPLALLTPHTDYTLFVPDLSGNPTFTTTDAPDLEPPPTPRLGAVTHFVSPVFGRSTCDLGGEAFTVVVPEFQTGDPLGSFQVFTGPTTSSIDTGTPALFLPAMSSMILGDASLCTSSFPVSARADLAIQIRVVDGAGNVSALSNALQLKGGAGCSAAGAGLAWPLVALLARRSARRRYQAR